MAEEIFPSLYLIRPQDAPEKTPFTYLLRRHTGNILFPTKADVLPLLPEIEALGSVTHMLLGDRHHAQPHTVDLAERLGAELCSSAPEATALRPLGVAVHRILPLERASFGLDLDIIPTPGHTPGALSYLWTNAARQFLFVGDTIVPVDGTWAYWVSKPHRSAMRRTVHMLAGIAFDVILSNSFAATPIAWIATDKSYRDAMFAKLEAGLSQADS